MEFSFAKNYLRQIPGGSERTVSTVGTTEVTDRHPESQPESQPESLARRVLDLLAGGSMSKLEISLRLGQKEISGQLNRVLRGLLRERLVSYSIPAKPNSRLQKYILTGEGARRLAEPRERRTSR